MTKPYRIEQMLGASIALAPRGGPATDARMDEVLATVRELKQALDPAQWLAQGTAGASADRGAPQGLLAEVGAMKQAILSTRREVARLAQSEREGNGIRRAADELDAVAESAERATTTILGAVEDIEANAALLHAAGRANDHASAILDRVVTLYEACHFQDLAGQRIAKVVGVLKFVEERLDRMIAVWSGPDGLRGPLGAEASAGRHGERALLNGPHLAGDPGHACQTDIDALFD